jgi:hypothetical protein
MFQCCRTIFRERNIGTSVCGYFGGDVAACIGTSVCGYFGGDVAAYIGTSVCGYFGGDVAAYIGTVLVHVFMLQHMFYICKELVPNMWRIVERK